jgi:hypothetical protein
MRSILLAFLFITSGALAMSQVATGDEKKADEKPKSPADKANYTEKVTVKKWASSMFLNPVEGVPAFRGEIKGKTVFYTRPPASNAHSPKGSEITDKDGVTWVVSDVSVASTYRINYVTKKAAEKKP